MLLSISLALMLGLGESRPCVPPTISVEVCEATIPEGSGPPTVSRILTPMDGLTLSSQLEDLRLHPDREGELLEFQGVRPLRVFPADKVGCDEGTPCRMASKERTTERPRRPVFIAEAVWESARDRSGDEVPGSFDLKVAVEIRGERLEGEFRLEEMKYSVLLARARKGTFLAALVMLDPGDRGRCIR